MCLPLMIGIYRRTGPSEPCLMRTFFVVCPTKPSSSLVPVVLFTLFFVQEILVRVVSLEATYHHTTPRRCSPLLKLFVVHLNVAPTPDANPNPNRYCVGGWHVSPSAPWVTALRTSANNCQLEEPRATAVSPENLEQQWLALRTAGNRDQP